MTFLFIATIGPVQPFIASARRTRDLYVGSTLLSELSKAAANAIAKEEGIANLIFPAPPQGENRLVPGTSFNVANKIVATIEQSPETVGEIVRLAIQDRLDKVKDEVFKIIKLDDRAKTKAQAQIANLIEYSWVAVPFASENDYENARKRAEAILGARKNTHFFREVTWGNGADKSSIDGQRECVIPLDEYPDRRKDDRTKVKEKVKSLYKRYRAGPHERLSAVDLLKRLGLLSMYEIVHSTSHIAATPFLERLGKMKADEQKKASDLWNSYIHQIKSLASSSAVEYIPEKLKQPHPVVGNVDGALLFKERLLEDTEYPDSLTPVYDALKAFFTFTDEQLDGLRPSPYYAILLADGDGMGKAIDNQAKKGPEGHQGISQALARFAGQVRNIVDTKYQGSLVYAGGDDVLALLPLHTVLACAKELHDVFGSTLSDFKDKNDNPPTLSVGIAVVHHLSLLQDALELARDAEHHAKGHRGKNALAIIVKKRGGEANKIVVPWNEQEERLALLVDLYNADIIPDGMAYELRTMLERLSASFKHNKPETDQEKEERKKLLSIIQLEAARILRRKLYFSRERVEQPDHQDIEKLLTKHLRPDDIPEDIRKGLKTPHDQARYLLLRQIHVQEQTTDSFKISESADITNFVDALIIAQTFAEALKPAATKGFAE